MAGVLIPKMGPGVLMSTSGTAGDRSVTAGGEDVGSKVPPVPMLGTRVQVEDRVTIWDVRWRFARAGAEAIDSPDEDPSP